MIHIIITEMQLFNHTSVKQLYGHNHYSFVSTALFFSNITFYKCRVRLWLNSLVVTSMNSCYITCALNYNKNFK